ncbi:MAG: DoxX family protein [Thaumarchaeota archaeon]|nr:DoxX family protein [Nitrososphaerota archaeon]
MTLVLEPLLPYTPYLALLIRVLVGASLVIHGYPKMGKTGREQAIGFMKSMSVPGGAAVAAAILEFFGGLFLIAGFIVPIVALFFAIEFAAIIVMKKRKMNAVYISPGKPNYEIDATYLFLSLVMLVLGAGAISIDALLGL